MVGQWYYQNVLCPVIKNQDLLKKQEACLILSNLGLKTPLCKKIPLLGDILFWMESYWTL